MRQDPVSGPGTGGVTAGGARAGAPVPRERTRGGATASRDIRDFFGRPTSSSGPTPNPDPRPSATPNRDPSPNLKPTQDPDPNLILGPPSSLCPGPGPVRDPAPNPDPVPVQNPDLNFGAERSVWSSLTHKPFPCDHAPSPSPNPGPGPDVTPCTDPNLDPVPNPGPNTRPKRPRLPLVGEPARPPPPFASARPVSFAFTEPLATSRSLVQ